MSQAQISSSNASVNADNSSYMAASQAELAAALTKRHPAHRETLGTLLTGTGRLSELELHRALAVQQGNPDARVGELLLSTGKISEDDLYRGLSAKLGVPYVRLGNFDIDPAALTHVPQDLARAYRVLPLMLHRERLVVAMSNPADADARGALSLVSRLPIEAVLATPKELELAIATHYASDDETDLSPEEAYPEQSNTPSQDESAEQLAQQQPIVRLVNRVLHDAVRRRASDIHIRPREHNAQVF